MLQCVVVAVAVMFGGAAFAIGAAEAVDLAGRRGRWSARVRGAGVQKRSSGAAPKLIEHTQRVRLATCLTQELPARRRRLSLQ